MQKTDARGVVTTFAAYDALNRPTTRSYSDGTPSVSYAYDSATNGKGRLAAVGSSVSTYSYSSYDALGRALSGSETLGSQTYSLSYSYNLAGHMTGMTYPSGRTVSYAFDGAGRTTSVIGNLGDGTQRNYVTGIVYDAGSRLTKEQFGTSTAIYNKLFYNSRGQLSEIRESTSYAGPTDTTWNRGAIINHYSDQCWGMCSGLGMSDNNGNLKKQEVYIPNDDQVSSYDNYAQFYDYDSLNRLVLVRENKFGGPVNWQQGYVYDRFGNRQIDQANTWGGGIPKPNFGLDGNTNRLTAPAGYAMSYDGAGNLTTDTCTGQGNRIYNAENQMTQAWANDRWQGYAYDGDGRRVRRNVDGTETWQVYGLSGELLAEYAANAAPASAQKEYGYRNGQLLVTAESSAQIHWLVTDQLGTPRMVFDQSGSLANASRHDYLPFGEELFGGPPNQPGAGGRLTTQGYTADVVRQKFTLKERDNETGLDFFGARYYGSTQGRFTSSDPLLSTGRPDDGQSWNRYSYTLNNPLTMVDPTGLFSFGSNLNDEQKKKITDAYNNLKASLGKLQQGSKAYKSIERSLARLGEPGKANGVVVTVGSVKYSGGADTDVNSINKGVVTIAFDKKTFSNSSSADDAANLGHEGVHADDAFTLFSQLRKNMGAFAKAWESNDVTYRTEYDAYFASAGVYQALQPDQLRSYGTYVKPDIPGKAQNIPEQLDLWNPSWAKLDMKTIESKQSSTIMTKLEAPGQTPYKLRGYNLTRPRGFQP